MMTRRTTIATAGAAAASLAAGAADAQTPAAGTRMLGPIRGVTTTAADLKAVEAAYSRYLGYRTVSRGHIPADAAAAWGAPALAGAATCAMEPANGEQTLLRFVEQAMPADFKPMTTYGWASTEIILQDCDALAKELAHSPFKIVAPPKSLDSSPQIKAFQAIGPANEMLYLTSLSAPLPPERDMPKTASPVGRCFIAVAGTPDRKAAEDWYLHTFGNTTGAVMNSRIVSLSNQNGVDIETRYDLTVTQCGDGTKIELDQYHDNAKPRTVPPGGLPIGMALVTFECAHFDLFTDRMIAKPAKAAFGPHKGARIGVMRGAGSELIELVEI